MYLLLTAACYKRQVPRCLGWRTRETDARRTANAIDDITLARSITYLIDISIHQGYVRERRKGLGSVPDSARILRPKELRILWRLRPRGAHAKDTCHSE